MGPLELERRPPPTKNQFGGMETAAPTLITWDPVIWHTLNGRDLLQVPEADRTGEVRQYYSVQRPHVADDGFAPDVVLHDGRRYRMVKVHDYDPQGGVYISFAALEDPQNKP
jgi:hypothetical protein